MTELTSQCYTRALFGEDPDLFVAPPWVRVRILDPETLEEAPEGQPGLIAVLDLANVGSALHLLTEDLGVRGFSVVRLVKNSNTRTRPVGLRERRDIVGDRTPSSSCSGGILRVFTGDHVQYARGVFDGGERSSVGQRPVDQVEPTRKAVPPRALRFDTDAPAGEAPHLLPYGGAAQAKLPRDFRWGHGGSSDGTQAIVERLLAGVGPHVSDAGTLAFSFGLARGPVAFMPEATVPAAQRALAVAGESAVAQFDEAQPGTPREAEVLALVARGQSNKLIARAFDLSLHTVKRHVANILDKLALASRGQAAAWWRTQV